ncbi:NAD(P)/FAD-dependent oxidoreductase [Pseudonocardia alni]|uniref:NAD(P)/FAD-dependent oxidoreductase n=1 Tax=Pseudonocardia alni TaxID=33907 RepID=UPI0006CB5760|nr:FAD-dependent oxidoreductase [Pseudonocardia sp. AL041005-10]ALE80340.1 pyridine nucleotide-disulfide oxidoreductase [Pseudonocardia sp. AL041005-10]
MNATAAIVGASHAGVQLAASLRQLEWGGDIVLISDEASLPYQRPPLSKAYLAGDMAVERLAIRGAEFYAKSGITRLNATVSSVDREARELQLADGRRVPYDRLAICTGARPARLSAPGDKLDGIFYLRTASDVEAIRSSALLGRRAVVIGGGYVGLETAASLRRIGLEVTVLEAAERVLGRVTAPEVSSFYSRVHMSEGVVVRTGAMVEAFCGDNWVREVVLSSGEHIPADFVVIGIGVDPNTELAAAAGLAIDNGIVIDDRAQTSDPLVVAAGDCTSHLMARYGRRIRLESIPSAGEQAKVAAATMCGNRKEIAALPWFWSDQYDVKMQIAGLSTGYDEVVIDGDPSRDRSFSCFYLRAGSIIAADCVNRPRDFMFSKQAIMQGGHFELPVSDGPSKIPTAGEER